MPFNDTTRLRQIALAANELLKGYELASPEYREYADDCLERMCRWLEKFITPRASKSAIEQAKALGISKQELIQTHWHQQAKKLKDAGRKNFHFEHMHPSTQMAKEIAAAGYGKIDLIHAILANADIAWITKKEDAQLTAMGARSRRPDPAASYEAAGITFDSI